jgi:hypothetical protein
VLLRRLLGLRTGRGGWSITDAERDCAGIDLALGDDYVSFWPKS